MRNCEHEVERTQSISKNFPSDQNFRYHDKSVSSPGARRARKICRIHPATTSSIQQRLPLAGCRLERCGEFIGFDNRPAGLEIENTERGE